MGMSCVWGESGSVALPRGGSWVWGGITWRLAFPHQPKLRAHCEAHISLTLYYKSRSYRSICGLR